MRLEFKIQEDIAEKSKNFCRRQPRSRALLKRPSGWPPAAFNGWTAMSLGRPDFAKQEIIMYFFHNNGCGFHGVETNISNNYYCG